MNSLITKWKTFKGKRKHPWLYAREDLLDETEPDDTINELDGEEFQENVKSLVGTWINYEYFLVSFLGRGTFSIVYLAFCYTTNQFIVLKMLLPCYYKEAQHEQEMIRE